MTRATLVIRVDDDDRDDDDADLSARPWTATLTTDSDERVEVAGGGIGATPLEAVRDLLTMLDDAALLAAVDAEARS